MFGVNRVSAVIGVLAIDRSAVGLLGFICYCVFRGHHRNHTITICSLYWANFFFLSFNKDCSQGNAFEVDPNIFFLIADMGDFGPYLDPTKSSRPGFCALKLIKFTKKILVLPKDLFWPYLGRRADIYFLGVDAHLHSLYARTVFVRYKLVQNIHLTEHTGTYCTVYIYEKGGPGGKEI
jgi:hypothetical protein